LTDRDPKTEKKLAKSRAKIAKSEAKAAAAREQAKLQQAMQPSAITLPGGVGISIRRREDGSDLVVSGLRDDQLKRLLPEINKEVLIAVTEEKSAFRAGLMKFVREGLVQTIIKVIAGLVVGYLLVRFGLQ
jgi:hypothetical protein